MEEKEILSEQACEQENIEACESEAKEETAAKPKRKNKAQMELLKLTEENEKLQNYALRMKADMENIKKRNEHIARDMYNDGRNDAIISFLPVVDNLERAMSLEMPDGIKDIELDRLIKSKKANRYDFRTIKHQRD